jgi:hypothetical protein
VRASRGTRQFSPKTKAVNVRRGDIATITFRQKA